MITGPIFLQRRSTVIAGKATISVLLHISKLKYKLGDVICHWLDGSIKTDILVTGLGNFAKTMGAVPQHTTQAFKGPGNLNSLAGACSLKAEALVHSLAKSSLDMPWRFEAQGRGQVQGCRAQLSREHSVRPLLPCVLHPLPVRSLPCIMPTRAAKLWEGSRDSAFTSAHSAGTYSMGQLGGWSTMRTAAGFLGSGTGPRAAGLNKGMY